MLDQEFINRGFCRISPDYYVEPNNYGSIHDLKKLFEKALADDVDNVRKRAYLKLLWHRDSEEIEVPADQIYYQTTASNMIDGGKFRQFKVMDSKILDIPIVKNIVAKNLDIIRNYPSIDADIVMIGLHFIRYQVQESQASYSSPPWLHRDDEPLVFIHLVNLSDTALGGDNLIADAETQEIMHVVRLEKDIDTLLLNQQVYHAVTPLGSRYGEAVRDVVLFTVEPSYTQYASVK